MLRVYVSAGCVLVGALVACTGGGGTATPIASFEPVQASNESATNSNERQTPSTEGAANSFESGGATNEPAFGAQGVSRRTSGGGAAGCAGTYSCDEGEKNPAILVLTTTTGGCSEGQTGLFFSDNGVVSLKGTVIGSWSTTSDGIIATGNGQTVSCTRTSSPAPAPSGTASGGTSGSSDSSGSGGTSGTSGTTINPPTARDAG
jgi:hypothetical protein